MRGFTFLNNPNKYNPRNAFVTHLSLPNNKLALFKMLKEKLNLPDYFGLNWDALHDCLSDFRWIQQHKIVLVHDEGPMLDENEFRIYISILNDTINEWGENKNHELEVVFLKSLENQIHQYLEQDGEDT